MLGSVTSNALASTLTALSLRQSVIATNIANINTPDYRAQVVSFEGALARSIEEGSGVISPTVTRSDEPTKLNGNNVNLDVETLASTEALLRYQFAAKAVEGPVTGLRTAMRTN
ncbi:flagellar biosynthesis protein FlgB [Cryobacterium frigoriphilum]|uniref:Flagellar basal body rod protein FlgB n=1 Tax=Cryobacterium frigoriphilum TaxID=1259150 RepID=A0A4R8ZV62_9MICO|nr:flagellar basal body protein [Cryobacterium frigoriphilum]TFD47268.1 flagellar biosynthesis protein FlgB [Cryobacterium frigoriphilum]